MSESSSVTTEPPAEAQPSAAGTEPTAPTTSAVSDRDVTARLQFWALVVGSGLFAIAIAILPAFDDFFGEDGWSYQTLVDARARFVIATLIAPVALLVLVAGLPLLRRYAMERGRALVIAGLTLLAVGSALFALAIASQLSLGVAAKSQLDPAVGEAFVEFAQDVDETGEMEPWFVGGIFLSLLGWLIFTIGARRARTVTTPLFMILLVIGLAWSFLPPGWALTAASAAMTAVFAWLGWRVLDGPAPVMVTRD
jgi:hypothetical protein